MTELHQLRVLRIVDVGQVSKYTIQTLQWQYSLCDRSAKPHSSTHTNNRGSTRQPGRGGRAFAPRRVLATGAFLSGPHGAGGRWCGLLCRRRDRHAMLLIEGLAVLLQRKVGAGCPSNSGRQPRKSAPF